MLVKLTLTLLATRSSNPLGNMESFWMMSYLLINQVLTPLECQAVLLAVQNEVQKTQQVVTDAIKRYLCSTRFVSDDCIDQDLD